MLGSRRRPHLGARAAGLARTAPGGAARWQTARCPFTGENSPTPCLRGKAPASEFRPRSCRVAFQGRRMRTLGPGLQRLELGSVRIRRPGQTPGCWEDMPLSGVRAGSRGRRRPPPQRDRPGSTHTCRPPCTAALALAVRPLGRDRGVGLCRSVALLRDFAFEMHFKKYEFSIICILN